jgi:uncharacterized protein YdaU (DUF1376 family)
MHYYQHHIGDFIKATARLSDSQTMTYLRMLWMYYDTEKPFSNDPEALAFLLGANVQEVILILNSFFKLIENEWRHTRCDDEIAKFHLKSDRAKTANKIRWGSKMDEKSDPDKIATNNHKPITNIDITPKPPKGAISLEQYLSQCRDDSKKPIPEDSPVFTYAKEIGLPHDFLKLQWLEFKDRYTAPGAKKYKAWPTVFAKSVRDNWFRLWMLKDDQYVLTTTGLQAQKLHKVAA